MKLTKIIRIAAVALVAAMGFTSMAQAAVDSVFFSSSPSCVPVISNAAFVTGGPAVPLHLCMSTSGPTITCGFTAVLRSAASESGRFVLTTLDLGSNYSDPTWNVKPIPLSIDNPAQGVDIGGTSGTATTVAPIAAAANQLLASFNLSPQLGATNGTYVISMDSKSVVAVSDLANFDSNCGATFPPIESPIAASITLTRNTAPFFTSATAATFSSSSSGTFDVIATGNPTPVISLTSGTPPSGLTLTQSAGKLTIAGTPGSTGSFPLVFSAVGSSTVTQNFTLTVTGGQSSQTITFVGPTNQTFSSTTIALSATASSGLAVTFSTSSPSVCSIVGSNVTMLTLGTCIIVASQAGNATFSPASQVTQSFGISGAVPGAPTNGVGSPGDSQATIAFTPPASTGGYSISSYTASCGAFSASAASSPITVLGLTNNTMYQCSVTATNQIGTGPASAQVSVTPSAASPLLVLGVKSRKTHAAAGVFDLTLDATQPIGGTVTTEPRLIGAGHVIVYQFSNPITSGGTAAALDHLGAPIGGTPTVTFTPGGNEVVVTFVTAIADKSRLTLTLSNVNGLGGNFPVSFGLLAGDSNNSRIVNVGDVIAAAGRSGNTLDQSNFRFDVNLNGLINVGDTLAIFARSGNALN